MDRCWLPSKLNDALHMLCAMWLQTTPALADESNTPFGFRMLYYLLQLVNCFYAKDLYWHGYVNFAKATK